MTNKVNTSNKNVSQQLSFEDSMESLEELTTYTCKACGQGLLDSCTASSCDDPECEYDTATSYELSNYQELDFNGD